MKKTILMLLHVVAYLALPAQILVKEINPGSSASSPQNFVALGNLTLFIATDKTHGFELWKTDGTESNTTLVSDIYPGPIGSLAIDVTHGPEFTPLVVMGNKVYFFAIDTVSGFELWSSDGTASGTSLVKDIAPGSESGLPILEFRCIISTGTQLYFGADDGIHGMELWKSDGTANGTVMVKEINPSGHSRPSEFFADGTFIYFKANDGVHGNELWKTDGTPAGTSLLLDIYQGSESSDVQEFISFNNHIYFSANDGISGFEFWKTDGTTSGTQLVKDINVGGGSLPHDPIVYNNRLLFLAYPGTGKSQLWSSDGTAAGTLPFQNDAGDYTSASPAMTIFNGKLFFSATDGSNGFELWSSDGTPNGTSLFYDINKGSGKSSNPNHLIVANGNLYFIANDGANGFELWKTDGTPSGTSMLNDICPGSCGFVAPLFKNANTLFFSGNHPNAELYKLDLITTDIPSIQQNQLLAYPNPFSDQIQLSGTEVNAELILFDLLGNEIIRQKTSSLVTTINTRNLVPGVYILRYVNGNNRGGTIKICKGQ